MTSSVTSGRQQIAFLPLDETVASTAVFVIVSWSDRRATTLLGPAKSLKKRQERNIMWQRGANRNPFASSVNELIPDPHVPQTKGLHRLSTSCGLVERSDHHCGDDSIRSCSGRNFLKAVQPISKRFSELKSVIHVFHSSICRPLDVLAPWPRKWGSISRIT